MRYLASIVLLTLLAGCAAPPLERPYLLTDPGLDEPAALVMVLHGGFGSAEQARSAYGWDALAESEGFVVVYPDGVGRAWNAGDGCCGRAGSQGVDDVAYLSSVVDEVSERVEIDPSRVFVTGMSNGAMMSYRMACDTDLFAAIAPVSGTLLGSCDSPAPVSVLHIHGTADESVRMDGGAGSGAENIDGMAIDELHELWLSVDGCPELTVTADLHVTTSSAECGDDRVTLLTVAAAGHQWPGSTRSAAQERLGADEPSAALDATAVIWEFFDGVQ